MEETTLSRTNKRPITFMGERVAEASTWTPQATRWTKAAVFKTDKDKFILGLAHITQWQGEEGRYAADVFETAGALVSHMEVYSCELAEEIAKKLDVKEAV